MAWQAMTKFGTQRDESIFDVNYGFGYLVLLINGDSGRYQVIIAQCQGVRDTDGGVWIEKSVCS